MGGGGAPRTAASFYSANMRILTYINFPASSQQIKCNSLYLHINVILYLRTKCKTLYKVRRVKIFVKSVQSALSDLLTTSATHGTFSRPSTKRGLTLIDLELNTNARELLLIISSESVNMSVSLSHNHKIEKCKSIVFFRQYRRYRFS